MQWKETGEYMDKIYDILIIGAGPAGLSAAIYAARARLSCLVLETSSTGGGQVLTTYEVDNYPGLPGISGYDLGTQMQEHAVKLGVQFVTDRVTELLDEGSTKVAVTQKGRYEARSILIATGAVHAKLGVPGEEELAGMGVSYCATCDGAFFRNKTVAVVGGGDVAVEDAIFMARVCKKVYLIHRRDSLRAARILQDSLMEQANVEIIWDTVATGISGEKIVEKLALRQVKTEESRELEVQGVFIAVGIRPNTEVFRPLLKMNQGGYIEAGEEGLTNIPGIFVAGDARTKQLRQIVTAVADGANAVTSIQNYLLKI